MTTKAGVRASSAAALAFSAMLALSACGGGDDAAANGGSPAEDVGDNAEAQGVYISHSENSGEILAIHGKDIAIMGYGGNTCDDFNAFFDKAKAGDFSGVNEDSVGTLNDTQSQMMFGSDTGYDPKPVSVNSPDAGYITVGNDGDYFVPKDSDEGKQAFDVWRNAQCG